MTLKPELTILHAKGAPEAPRADHQDIYRVIVSGHYLGWIL